MIQEISIDEENPELVHIKTLKQNLTLPKEQIFPLCSNYNDAADQLAKFNRGIELSHNLENQVGTNVDPNTFYANRGVKVHKSLQMYEEDKDVEFDDNDDLFELVFIDSQDDSNVLMLSFHA